MEVKPASEEDTLLVAFAQMVENQRNLIDKVKATATSVADASKQLSSASEQTARATQQIASTVQQIAKGTSEQSVSLQETSASVEQLSGAIIADSRGGAGAGKGCRGSRRHDQEGLGGNDQGVGECQGGRR